MGLSITRVAVTENIYCFLYMKEKINLLIHKFRILSDDKDIGGNLIIWSFLKLVTSLEKLKQASAALTYHTLFALVPIMAMMIAVANLMGYSEAFRAQVESFFVGQEGVAVMLLSFAEKYLTKQMNYWLGASVGMVFLIYSLFSIFQTIDKSVNSLWNLKGHSLKTQLKVFVFVLLVPFASMILLALWLSISSYFEQGIIHEVNIFIITVGVYVSCLFAAYKFIPNTKVEVKYALRSAVVCGVLFAMLQYFGFLVFTAFCSYRNIYGDLASLILFILWIYFSWTICLAGSRWNYFLQEGKRLDEENRYKKISCNYRKFLSLLLIEKMESLGAKNNDGAFTVQDITLAMVDEYNIPTHVVHDIVDEFVDKGVVVEDMKERLLLDDAFKGRSLNVLLEKLDVVGDNSYAMQLMFGSEEGESAAGLWRAINNASSPDKKMFSKTLSEVLRK